jgi:hypothetical protein
MGANNPERFTRGGAGGTIDISGTKMRQHLESGDAASFVSGLPSWMNQGQKQQVFDILSGKQLQTEIRRAKKGTARYSTYLEEIMDELQHIKSEYDHRKKSGARYRKEASKIHDAYTELKRLKKKNDKVLHSSYLNERMLSVATGHSLNESDDKLTRDDIRNFIVGKPTDD